MYLSNIKLWNFRKFGSDESFDTKKPNLDLNFKKGLNVIIGENDSGKTAIIDSIKLVLKTHSYEYLRIEDEDFHTNSSRFRIELVFDDLSDDEAKNFTEWLGWIGEGESAKPFLRLIYDVRKVNERISPSDVLAGVDEEGYPLTAEAREYLKITYLKPLRDAENELVAKRNSRLSQILLYDDAFKEKKENHELVKIFEEARKNLKDYFLGEFKIQLDSTEHRPQEGKKIKDKIDGYIKKFYDTSYETEFDANASDLKGILEKLTLSIQSKINPGLGTLNRLFMAAELLHLNKDNWSGIRLGLIEELEAHLHPQAQMQVIEALQKYNQIQLILTTHSPNLASKLNLEDLIICNNANAFPMGEAYTKLGKENYKFLEKFLDTTKANLFFVKGVILVEGWAEEILIPSIAKAIGINLTEKGVSIVNIGHTGFDHYAKIYLRQAEPHMKIPVAVITDSDIREYEKAGNNCIKRNANTVQQETTRKLSEINGQSELNVQYFSAPNWTLEYSLFKSTSITALFQNTVKAIHTHTDWNTDFEKELAEKLISKVLKKTEIAYRIANTIDEDLEKFEKKEIEAKTITISEDANDTVSYLIKAIKYATGN